MLSLNDMFGRAFAQAGAQAPAPQHQPVAAVANPQTPPPAAAPASAPSSALSSLFPNFDVSQGFNPGYMQQFAAPGGGYGGDSGQYYDNGYQIKGSDGKLWTVNPDFGGRGGYTFTSSDPLDNHNRYSLSFDASGNQTDNQNWKDKSWFDDNKGIIGVLGAAAGGYAAWGGTGAGAAEGAAGAAGGTGAISSPVYGATAVGTPLTGASPGVVGAGGAAAGGGLMSGGLTGNPIIDKALGSAAANAVSSGVGSMFGGNGGGSSIGGGLGGLISGGYDYYAQNKAANDMLDWMKSQQGKIDNIYDPNGPVAKMMYDRMQAQDAAAGRNSQYGVRTNNFLGQFGGDYAKYTAALTQGLAGNYQNAFNKQASAGTGLATGIGNAIGGGVNSGLQNLFTQNMSSAVNPSSGAGFVGSGVSSGIPAWDNAYYNAGAPDDYGQYL